MPKYLTLTKLWPTCMWKNVYRRIHPTHNFDTSTSWWMDYSHASYVQKYERHRTELFIKCRILGCPVQTVDESLLRPWFRIQNYGEIDRKFIVFWDFRNNMLASKHLWKWASSFSENSSIVRSILGFDFRCTELQSIFFFDVKNFRNIHEALSFSCLMFILL